MKKVHFFKIILNKTQRDKKLGIPTKFIREHGNGLSSPVILKVPSGMKWQVELLKSDGEVWLEKGWQEFANYHSLEFGHFLVFKYEGHDNFSVIIFDKTASEIEYPCSSSFALDRHHEPVMEKSPLPSHQSCKRRRNDSTYKTSNLLSPTSPACLNSQGTPSSSTKVANSTCSKREFGGKLKQSKCKKNAGGKGKRQRCSSGAFKVANNISKPPFFKAAVRLERLKPTVTIPIGFCRDHFELDKIKSLTLQVADIEWPVKLIKYANWNVAKLCSGWPAFAMENSLQAGDVCIFELIKSDVFNVTINRRVK